MRRSAVTALSFASLLVFGYAITEEDVSRAGMTYKMILDITGPGAKTPANLFNKTKNPSDEPKYTNFLTPLGQR